MRTPSEIVARIEAVKACDFFGFEVNDFIVCLPFEDAKQYLKPDAPADDWQQESTEPDAVRARIVDYLPFAFEKCDDKRGLSAMRSISHFRAWTWLLGDAEAVTFLSDEDNYPQYGRPMLEYLCQRFGGSPSPEAK